MSEKDLIFLSTSPTWEQVWWREAAFNARRIGDQCIGETPQETIKGMTLEGDIRFNPGIIVSCNFSRNKT